MQAVFQNIFLEHTNVYTPYLPAADVSYPLFPGGGISRVAGFCSVDVRNICAGQRETNVPNED